MERFGAKVIWIWAALIWSSATLLSGFAQGFWSLFILRSIIGFGEGTHFPAAQRAVANWLPQSERGSAFGMLLLGVPCASLIGAPLLSSIIAAWGWRSMFIVLGVLGYFWVLFWFKFFKDRPSESPYVIKEELTTIGHIPPKRVYEHIPWRPLLRSRTLWSNHLAFFSFGYFVFFGIIWYPGYLQETFHLTVREMGLYLMIPWGCAALFVFLGGLFSDYLWKKTKKIRIARTYVIAGCLFLVSVFLIPLLFVKTLFSTLFFLSLATGFAFFMNASIFAVQTDLLRPVAGIAQGINSSFFALAGIISPALTGFVIDAFGNFHAAFFLVIGLSFLSFLIVLRYHRPEKYI